MSFRELQVDLNIPRQKGTLYDQIITPSIEEAVNLINGSTEYIVKDNVTGSYRAKDRDSADVFFHDVCLNAIQLICEEINHIKIVSGIDKNPKGP